MQWFFCISFVKKCACKECKINSYKNPAGDLAVNICRLSAIVRDAFDENASNHKGKGGSLYRAKKCFNIYLKNNRVYIATRISLVRYFILTFVYKRCQFAKLYLTTENVIRVFFGLFFDGVLFFGLEVVKLDYLFEKKGW